MLQRILYYCICMFLNLLNLSHQSEKGGENMLPTIRRNKASKNICLSFWTLIYGNSTDKKSSSLQEKVRLISTRYYAGFTACFHTNLPTFRDSSGWFGLISIIRMDVPWKLLAAQWNTITLKNMPSAPAESTAYDYYAYYLVYCSAMYPRLTTTYTN